MNPSPFCTCTDLKCPFHPRNHDRGCAPCVAKNLRQGEIPSCFFRALDPDMEFTSFRFEDFAEAVKRAKQGEDPADGT